MPPLPGDDEDKEKERRSVNNSGEEGREITEETNLMEMIQRLNGAIALIYKQNPLCLAMDKVPGLKEYSSRLRTAQLACVPVLREAVTSLQNKLDHLFMLKYNIKVGGEPVSPKASR